MADFVYPQVNPPPDVLGSYLRGQMAPLQMQGAQQSLQQGQQQLEAGGLNIEQLRMALQNQRMVQDIVRGSLGGQMQGGPPIGGVPGGMQTGPQGSVSSTPSQASGGLTSSPMFEPSTQAALALLQGRDPVKAAQDAQDYKVKQAQLQAQGPLDLIDSVFNSSQPARTVMANPSLIAKWPQIAQALGLDPVRDFNDANVRRGLAMAGNNLRGSVGMAAKEYPVELQTFGGAYGAVLQRDPVTGKMTQVQGREMPSYSLKDVYDPSTNTTRGVPVQTGGWGMGGVNPNTGQGTAGAAPAGVNLGMKAPTDPELKAAMFGSEMRAGLNTMTRLESAGFNLSPKTRTLLINAATEEDPGAIKQLLSQEALVHGMTPQEQTYVAALMPMLQAAGHDQSGARLTTAQIRQNVESLLPVDVRNRDAMAQVQKNREGFYTGLLSQAGSAVHLPQYEGTLGADLKAVQGRNVPMLSPEEARKLPKGSHFRSSDGRLLVRQ